MSSAARRTRLLKLEAAPTVIPTMPELSDEQLRAIIDGTMETGALTEAQVAAVVRGRNLNELSDNELTYIISG